MASLNSYQYFSSTFLLMIFLLLLHLLLSSVSCFIQPQPSISARGLLFEEKNRLGSMPPSCHNKCNECHPCMAVQVPSLPRHDQVLRGLTRTTTPLGFFDPSHQGNRYSNYKPLGWKCHCGDHFFNP